MEHGARDGLEMLAFQMILKASIKLTREVCFI